MPARTVEGFGLRRAFVHDAAIIVAHRRAMFHAQGYRDVAALDAMVQKFLPWLEGKMKAGEYLAWFAVSENDERISAGTGLWLMDWPSHMLGASARRGNILNVYTEPEFRRRGLARWLMETALEWCTGNEIDLVVLHASADGWELYESLGFKASNEMRIAL